MNFRYKYSLIMPYHKRHLQFRSTLESLIHHYERREDFEVVLVEDMKNYLDDLEHQELMTVVETYGEVLPIKMVTAGDRNNWNPAPLYNVGADLSQGQYLILTNPECVHQNNILEGLDEEFSRHDCYVVCACLSTPVSIISAINLPFADGQWYQHSKVRNILCHFCAALSYENYQKMGGFDNNYSMGVCFEDDDFRNRIIQSGLPIVTRDDLVVVHLSHSKSKAPDFSSRHRINQQYFRQIWGANASTAEQQKL